jgi:hypothetical protein
MARFFPTPSHFLVAVLSFIVGWVATPSVKRTLAYDLLQLGLWGHESGRNPTLQTPTPWWLYLSGAFVSCSLCVGIIWGMSAEIRGPPRSTRGNHRLDLALLPMIAALPRNLVRLFRAYAGVDDESFRQISTGLGALSGASRILAGALLVFIWSLLISALIGAPLLRDWVAQTTLQSNSFQQQTLTVPDISVYASAAAIGLGLAAVLTGLSFLNVVLFIGVAALIFQGAFGRVELVGLTNYMEPFYLDLQGYTLAAITGLLPILVAGSPVLPTNRWLRLIAVWVACFVAMSITFDQSPIGIGLTQYFLQLSGGTWFPSTGQSHFATAMSYIVIVIASVPIAAVLATFLRPLSVLRIFIIAFIASVALVCVELLSYPSMSKSYAALMVSTVDLSLHRIDSIVGLLWFLLGANIADIALNFTGMTLEQIRKARLTFLSILLVSLSLGEIVYFGYQLGDATPTLRVPPWYLLLQGGLWAHTALSAVLAVATVTLFAFRRLSFGLLIAFYAAWLLGLALVIASLFRFPEGLADALGLPSLSQTLMIVAVFWELLKGTSRLPLQSVSKSAAVGVCLSYLGLLTLFAAQINFDLAAVSGSEIRFYSYVREQESEFSGFQTFLIAMIVYRVLPDHSASGKLKLLFRRAFVAGLAASPFGYLLRAIIGHPETLGQWGNILGLAFSFATAYIVAVLMICGKQERGGRELTIIGAATSFGYGVGYVAGLPHFFGELLLFLPRWPYVLSVSEYLIFFLPPPPSADVLALNILGPAATALAVLARFGGASTSHGRINSSAILILALCYAAPIYQGDLTNSTVPMGTWYHDYLAIAYLACGSLFITAWLYRRLWTTQPNEKNVT